MKSLFNPIFLFQKRKSIFNRIKEIPMNFIWKIIYSLIDKGYLYHPDYEKLQKIHNKHKGKTGILIGNGPSVKIKDLEEIANNKEIITFAVNRFYLCYEQTTFRPHYILSSDQQIINDFGNEIVHNNVNTPIFLASLFKPQHIRDDFVWIKLIHGRPFRFSKDIKRSLMSGGGTLIAAIQLGYHMGIREFYLYGVDHNFDYKKDEDQIDTVKGDNNHFIDNYRSGKSWQEPRIDLVEYSFKECDKVLRLENGFLKNATHGGKLQVLERIAFNELING